MTTITKERIELFIKNPLENGLTRGEQMELARIALASLAAEPAGKLHEYKPVGYQRLVDELSGAERTDKRGGYFTMTWPEALTTVGIAMAVALVVYSICRWG